VRPGRPWRTVLAWGLAVPLLAWALVRTGGLEAGWPLVQVMAFTPYALALALLGLLAAVLLRRWVPALFLLLATLFLVLAVGPRAFGSPEPVGAGRPVRLLTSNLHFGRADPGQLLGLARARDVDLLVLSELTPEAERSLRDAGVDRLFPESVSDPRPGAMGAGIWSRWPLADRGRLETRAAQPVASVEVPDSIPFNLAGVHITAPEGPRSTSEWASDFDALPTAGTPGLPLILAGDFNATLDHERFRRLEATGFRDAGAETGRGLSFTWPSRIGWPPPVVLDHVLADRGIGFSDYDVESIGGSDHRAIYTELVLPPVTGPDGV